jgi:hypothetical protein
LEHLQVQRASFIKLGKKLGYYFVSVLKDSTNGTLKKIGSAKKKNKRKKAKRKAMKKKK